MDSKVKHPGHLLNQLVLEPSGLSQSALARRLGFNQPQPVNELVKGKRAITPKMALLLEQATTGGYPAEFWLLAQLRWDVEQARASLPRARLAMVENIGAGSIAHEPQAECRALFAACKELREMELARGIEPPTG